MSLLLIWQTSGANSFTADAVIVRERTGSFTADAVILGEFAFTADAVLRRESTATFTADAVLKREGAATFTADAVIPGGAVTYEASFTADAVLRIERTGSFTASAILRRAQSASATADAVLKRTVSGSFTADSSVKRTISATFTANAARRRERTSSFTANALKKLVTSASITADALLAGRLTADAIKKKAIAKAFSADATILAHSFTISAYIVVPAPGEPGGPPLGTKIPAVIKVNGVDITSDVIIKTATFTQAVNARPGQFAFEVKDDDHIYNFVSGGRVTLDINNSRAFDGYLDRATLRYAFPVDITTAPGETPRMWRLEGPDLNILFQKRMIFDQANPNADLPTYAAGTTDVFIIRDFMRHYVDLTGDDITYDGIVHVGSPNPDADGYIIPTGSSWGLAMSAIGQLPGAVWGLSQDRDLFYEDDSTESAPFQLSDTPDNSTSYGYRDFAWTDDGTRLVNDAQVWGAGTGSPDPVYSNTVDAPSVAEHGRWQLPGQFRGDMYRQATVDNAADSIVYGSPQNLHGGKDPYVLVECTVKQHGLRAGHKVRFLNEVYGLDKVLPVRRLTITFVNLYDVMYRLELTQEIDAPWFFAEFPGFRFPPFRRPPRTPRGPRWTIPEPVSGECECDAPVATYDSFTRTTTPGSSDPTHGFGTPSSGGQYWFTDGSDAPVYVNGTRGVIPYGAGDSFSADADGTLPGPMWGGSFIAEIVWEYDTAVPGPVGDYDYTNFGMFVQGNDLAFCTLYVGNEVDDQPLIRVVYTPNGSTPDGVEDTLFVTAPPIGTLIHIKWEHQQGVVIRAKFWEDGDPEPDWMVSVAIPFTPVGGDKFFSLQGDTSYTHTEYVDDLAFVVNRCDHVQFDNFNRSVSSGLGMATNGVGWTKKSGGTAFSSVNGSEAALRGNTGAGSEEFSWNDDEVYAAPWLDSTPALRATTMRMRFWFNFAVPGAGAGYVRVIPAPGYSPEPLIDISSVSNVGKYGYNGLEVGKLDWVSGQVYIAEWAFDGTTSNFYVYEEGDTPGTPSTTTTLPGDGRMLLFYTNQSTIAYASAQVYVDSIDFDYDGRPCYIECVDALVIDDFDRTETDEWGVSLVGTEWELASFESLPPPNGSTWGVSPALGGWFRRVHGDGISNQDFDLIDFPGTAESPWLAESAILRFRFKVDVVPSLNDVNDYAQVGLLFQGFRWSAEVVAHINSAASWGEIEFDSGGGSIFADKSDWLADTWYTAEVRMTHATGPDAYADLRIWADTEAYPAPILSDFGEIWDDSAPSYNTGFIEVRLRQEYKVPELTNDYDNTISIDDIVFVACGGVEPGTGSAPAPRMGAYGCQTATRLSDTAYELFFMPVSGTTEVYLNGRLMRLTYDYTENVAARTIDFLMSVDAADTVYVCYTSYAAGEWTGDIN